MARGTALTNVEKYAIQGLLSQNLSIGAIATKIGRSDTLVRKYVDEELSEFKKLIEEESGHLPKDVEKAVYDKLLSIGMDKLNATSCIKYVRSKLTETVTMDKVDHIVNACLKRVNVRSLFITKGEGGRKGVTVMTSGAGQVLDDRRQNRTVRNVDDHIFKQEHAIPKGLEEDE